MKTSEQETVTTNQEQKLYVIPCNGGYSCLGFDVLEDRYRKLAGELINVIGLSIPAPKFYGTVERYEQYQWLVDQARAHHAKTGWRSRSELTPQLIGFEGKRVEIVHRWSDKHAWEKTRFIVGKSTGFIPCHLEIKTRRSIDGGAVCLGEIRSVQIV